MSTEEPAWKAAFKHAIYMASYNAIPTVDGVLEHLLPHIQAAEERGRAQGLVVAGRELTAMANRAMEEADRQGGRTTSSDTKYDKAAVLYKAARFFPESP